MAASLCPGLVAEIARKSGAIRGRFGRFGRIWPRFQQLQLTETQWFRSLSNQPRAG